MRSWWQWSVLRFESIEICACASLLPDPQTSLDYPSPTENTKQSFFVRLDYTFILHVNDKLVKRNNNIILLVLVIKSETWQNAEDHPIFTELRNEDVIKHFMKPTSCFTPRVWIGKSQDTTRIMMQDIVGSFRSSRSQISFCLSVRLSVTVISCLELWGLSHVSLRFLLGLSQLTS